MGVLGRVCEERQETDMKGLMQLAMDLLKSVRACRDA
jgi:hypothetical protein